MKPLFLIRQSVIVPKEMDSSGRMWVAGIETSEQNSRLAPGEIRYHLAPPRVRGRQPDGEFKQASERQLREWRDEAGGLVEA